MTGRDVTDFKRQLHAYSGRARPKEILDWFDDTKYAFPARNQARLAFETAKVARHIQLEYIKEQEELLLKARRCAENAAHLDRIIKANEQLVLDLRLPNPNPTYSIGTYSPGEQIKFDLHFATQTPFREISSTEPAIPSSSSTDSQPVQSSLSAIQSSSNVFQNLPPIDNTGWETDSEVSLSTIQEQTDEYEGLYDDLESMADTEYGVEDIEEEDQQIRVNREPESESSNPLVNQPQLIRYGGDLGELRVFEWPVLAYPDRIIVRSLLPDGLPEFDYKQVFGQLPPQIEISLELLTKRRLGFATRFVVDATIEENIVQMRVLDEFDDPPSPRARKVLYVPWAVLQGVPTEWTKEAVRVRRYSALATEHPPTFFLDVSVTAAKNLRPSIQVLGEPFAKQYVVSYARFDEDEGAIALRFGNHLEWVRYTRYTPDPPRIRQFPFRRTHRH